MLKFIILKNTLKKYKTLMNKQKIFEYDNNSISSM